MVPATRSRENRTFYCDGKELTTAKERALNGDPVEATQPQVLGEDRCSVLGTHEGFLMTAVMRSFRLDRPLPLQRQSSSSLLMAEDCS